MINIDKLLVLVSSLTDKFYVIDFSMQREKRPSKNPRPCFWHRNIYWMSNRRLRPRQYLFQKEVRAKVPSFLANIARIANATNATNVTNGTNGTNGTNIINVTPPPAWNSSRTVKTPLPQRRFNFQRLFMVLNWTMSKIKKYKKLGRWAWFALILYISNHQHTFIIHSSIFFTSAQACLGVDPTILAALCAEKPCTPKWGTISAVSERVKRQRLMWMMWKATEASWISTLPQSMNWWSQIISGGAMAARLVCHRAQSGPFLCIKCQACEKRWPRSWAMRCPLMGPVRRGPAICWVVAKTSAQKAANVCYSGEVSEVAVFGLAERPSSFPMRRTVQVSPASPISLKAPTTLLKWLSTASATKSWRPRLRKGASDVVVTTTVKRLRWQSGGYNDYSLLFIWLFILHGLYVHLPIHFCQAFYVCAWPVYVCAWPVYVSAWPLYHYELNRSFWDTIIWIQIFWDMESMCMCGWMGLAMLSTKSCTKTFISFTDWSSSLLAVGSHAITTAKVIKSKSHR